MPRRKKSIKVSVPDGVDVVEFERSMNILAQRALEIANQSDKLESVPDSTSRPPSRPWDPANNPRGDQNEYFERSKHIHRIH